MCRAATVAVTAPHISVQPRRHAQALCRDMQRPFGNLQLSGRCNRSGTLISGTVNRSRHNIPYGESPRCLYPAGVVEAEATDVSGAVGEVIVAADIRRPFLLILRRFFTVVNTHRLVCLN